MIDKKHVKMEEKKRKSKRGGVDPVDPVNPDVKSVHKDDDDDEYCGTVCVKFKSRFDPLNAVGTDVAKILDTGDKMVGKVIAQKLESKFSIVAVTYLVVYRDMSKEYINGDELKRYERIFSNHAVSDERLKPLMVTMK